VLHPRTPPYSGRRFGFLHFCQPMLTTISYEISYAWERIRGVEEVASASNSWRQVIDFIELAGCQQFFSKKT
jgi:hypothetical protein